MDNINGVVDSQKYIAESFKTTLNTTIKSKLKINCYSKLNGRTRMILYNRIERDYWNNEKVNQLFNTLKLKTDEQKIVRNLIEESEYQINHFGQTIKFYIIHMIQIMKVI